MPKGTKGFVTGNKEASIIWKGKKRPDISKMMKEKNNNPHWKGGAISEFRKLKQSIKKSFCEMCNFIPIHICQLDLDHKDGNKNNNSVSNLQTLCANCHRLKTYKEKETAHSFFRRKYKHENI